MPNMSLKKNEMPAQAPDVRNKNFKEVALGYSKETAVDEADRCLNCKNKPCVSGCPVNIDIPAFIQKVKDEDFDGAYDIISASSSLPAVCGRVCPQETPRMWRLTAGWVMYSVCAAPERLPDCTAARNTSIS